MKIKYLGTSAAEGVPALFCDCETCRKSSELGGRNVRSRSQAIIDDCLLIDFPCDSFYHFSLYGVDIMMDCTYGSMNELEWDGHMGLGRNIKCRNKMAEIGLLSDNAKAVLNHFSHNGTDVVYDDFKVIAEKEGFDTSYDGMEIEF